MHHRSPRARVRQKVVQLARLTLGERTRMHPGHAIEGGAVALVVLFPPAPNHGDGLIEQLHDPGVAHQAAKEPFGWERLLLEVASQAPAQRHAEVVVLGLHAGVGRRSSLTDQHAGGTRMAERGSQECREHLLDPPKREQSERLDEAGR